MKKAAKYTMYLEWVVMLVLLIGTMVIFNESGVAKDLKPDTTAGKVIMIVGIIIMAFIVLAVHELGHLLTGLMKGFRFELFVVGPFGFKRENDKVKAYLNKDLNYYGGVAATSPTNDHEDNARKFGHILLAGPIASVLFALLCFLLASIVGKSFGMVFYTGGLISIAIFLATTIPSRSGMFFTDRKRYQRLVNPGRDQQTELAMLRIMGKFSKDKSYKNIDEDDINTLVTDKFPFVKFFGLFNLICFQLETSGAVDGEVEREYEDFSKSMSKNLVKVFNQEIGKYKVKLESADAME